MNVRASARLAWSLWLLTALLMVAGTTLVSLNEHAPDLGEVSLWLSFATVGAVVAARRPRNAIGWLFLALGLDISLLVSAQAYARYAVGSSQPLPGADWAAWLGVWPIELGIPLLSLVFLLFPDGRLQSRSWRWLAWLAVAIGVLGTFASALSDVNFTHNFPRLDHPLPILARSVAGPVFDVSQASGLFLLVASASSLIFRLRRARADERQQIKLFAFASAILAVALFGFAMATPDPRIVFTLLAPLLPISAGLAIVKYRLYDIDRIINRTLVYGALTAVLGSAYVVTVTLAGTVLKGSALVTASATLAVAALFQPLRRRVQGFIDRRFYRRRYDAAQTAEAFSSRLRDEVDLVAMRAELLAVVQETMQPSGASLWLSEGEERRQSRVAS